MTNDSKSSREPRATTSPIRNGASCIYETDDDNAPLENWSPRTEFPEVHSVSGKGWINAYAYFTDKRIWPRGFPLKEISGSFSTASNKPSSMRSLQAPIQQGLADGSPDVDAVWRMTSDEEVIFERKPSISLSPGAWCPFNSQSTWWFPAAFPLMYLPSHCSFRMTDIWRSFVAQRCLWEMGYGIVFHSSEVYQERNFHDLQKDFTDEIPGYLRNEEIRQILEDVSLGSSASENLLVCYSKLVENELFDKAELDIVTSWCHDVEVVLSDLC